MQVYLSKCLPNFRSRTLIQALIEKKDTTHNQLCFQKSEISASDASICQLTIGKTYFKFILQVIQRKFLLFVHATEGEPDELSFDFEKNHYENLSAEDVNGLKRLLTQIHVTPGQFCMECDENPIFSEIIHRYNNNHDFTTHYILTLTDQGLLRIWSNEEGESTWNRFKMMEIKEFPNGHIIWAYFDTQYRNTLYWLEELLDTPPPTTTTATTNAPPSLIEPRLQLLSCELNWKEEENIQVTPTNYYMMCMSDIIIYPQDHYLWMVSLLQQEFLVIDNYTGKLLTFPFHYQNNDNNNNNNNNNNSSLQKEGKTKRKPQFIPRIPNHQNIIPNHPPNILLLINQKLIWLCIYKGKLFAFEVTFPDPLLFKHGTFVTEEIEIFILLENTQYIYFLLFIDNNKLEICRIHIHIDWSLYHHFSGLTTSTSYTENLSIIAEMHLTSVFIPNHLKYSIRSSKKKSTVNNNNNNNNNNKLQFLKYHHNYQFPTQFIDDNNHLYQCLHIPLMFSPHNITYQLEFQWLKSIVEKSSSPLSFSTVRILLLIIILS
jgi:hypothetical protein